MNVNVPARMPEPRRRSSRGGPDLCTISVDVEVVTAILGGGSQTRALDDVDVIRAATVRGHLRFWWRALRGHEFAGATDLYAAEFFGNDYKPRGLDGPLMFANGAQLLAALAPQRLDMNDFGALKGLSSARNKCEYEHGFLPKTPSQGEVERYLAKATEIIAHACGGKDALERRLREFEFPKLPDQQSES